MTNKTKKITLLTAGIAGTLLASSVAAVTLSACTLQAALPPTDNPNAPKPTPQVQYNTKINWDVLTNEDWELDPSNIIIPVDRLEQDENGFIYADKAHTQLIAMLPSIKLSEITIPAQVTQISGYVNVKVTNGQTTETNVAAFQDNTNIRTIKFAPGSKLSAIATNAFNGCSNLENIELPNSVRTIQDNAFQNTPNLTTINLSSVTYIGNSAFSGSFASDASNQTTLNLSNVMRIGNNAFQNIQNIKEISFGNNSKLLSIGNYSFNGAKLSPTFDLSNAKALATIGNNAFEGTTNVETIKLPESFGFASNPLGTSVFKNSSIKSIDLSKTTIKSIPDATFKNASNLSDLKLNDEITSFGNESFSGTSSLSTFKLPNELSTLGTSFKDGTGGGPNGLSGITELDFSNTKVTEFPTSAFDGANKLSKIILNDKFTTISQWAFRNATIQSMGTKGNITEGVIKLPASVETLSGGNNFQGSKATILDLSETSITSFNANSLAGMWSILEVKFPNNLTSISGKITSENNLSNTLTSIDLSNTKLTSIGNNNFEGATKLETIKLPNTITSIGNSAFKGTKITSLKLPNTITSIGNNAFANTKLIGVDLSNTKINALSNNLFSDNSELTTVIVPNGLRTLGSRVFGYRGGVPQSEIDKGNTSTPKFTTFGTKEDLTNKTSRALESKVVIPSNVEDINDAALEHSGITNIDLSKITSFKNSGTDLNKKQLPSWFFNGNTKLQTVVLPTWVSGAIGESTFKETKSLQSVTVAGFTNPTTYADGTPGVFNISNSNITGFRNDNQFTNSNIGTFSFPTNFNRTIIPTNAFKNTKIASLDGIVDQTTTTIKSNAFANNESLTAFTTTKAKLELTALANIESSAFENGSLTSVDLSSSVVTTIGENAFSNNAKLETLKLPATITSNTANIANNVKEGFTLTYPNGINLNTNTTTTTSSFANNQLLTDVDLSKSANLTTIAKDTFSGSTKLSKVVLPAKAVKWELNTTNNGGNPFFNNAEALNIEFTAFKKQDNTTAPTNFADIDESVKTQIANIMNIFSRYVAAGDIHPVQYSEWANSNSWIDDDLTKDNVLQSWTDGTSKPLTATTTTATLNHNGVTWTYKKDGNNITIESDLEQTPINIYRAGTTFDTTKLTGGKQTYFSSPIAGPNSAPNNTKVKVTLKIVTN